jgi:hypothetical protein
MALRVFEFFGFDVDDTSPQALDTRRNRLCPFLGAECQKKYSDGLPMGTCSLKPATSGPVICCPIRLYADNYRILKDVADSAFGPGKRLIRRLGDATCDGHDVLVFGKRWGKELRLPNRGKGGRYFVDWILVLIDSQRNLREFVAVEVQTMDTTGTYRPAVQSLYKGIIPEKASKAGINWENVSKRILPQIIYKGHVLRREPLCTKGLFFICPRPVYDRIITRLGGTLQAYHPQAGSLTFRWYDLEGASSRGTPRSLVAQGQHTTTIDQVALAFTSPANLPEPRVYESAIRAELDGNG